MKLSKMDCSRGAPMGRRDHHAHGVGGIVFELEWVPFTDGGYDAGGAYWGTPDNLYCAVGTLDDEEVAQFFIRAPSRIEAMFALFKDYGDCKVLPVNGSLIKQMIAFIEAFMADEIDNWLLEDAQEEIDGLQELLKKKGLA